jgi:hypothetical protein
MKFFSNKLTVLMFTLCIMLISGSSFACAQSNNSAGKTNFTKADFEKLRWLEGTWRGSDGNGQNPFFERYRFVGDGKIEIDSFSDSTLSKVGSQSSVYLENSEIIHKNGRMLWRVNKLDGSLIEFAPKEKATNFFAWQKESADVWLARLAGKDAQGKSTEKVYRMERIKQ